MTVALAAGVAVYCGSAMLTVFLFEHVLGAPLGQDVGWNLALFLGAAVVPLIAGIWTAVGLAHLARILATPNRAEQNGDLPPPPP